MDNMMVCTGFQDLATSSTPAGLTIPSQTIAGASRPMARGALIRAVGNNANYTLDGTTPGVGAGGGMPLNTADTSPFWIGNLANLQRFKAVATTGTGHIEVLYFN